jgi:hypothetical protein
MRNRTLIYIGVGIIIIGAISLIDVVTDLDLGRLLCPTLLILLGVWFLLRPRLLGPDVAFNVKLLGDVRRRGVWHLTDEEIWSLIGDVKLDLTEATIPAGETTLRILGIVGDIRVTVPKGIGIAVESTSIATEARVFGQKHSRVVTPYRYESDGYGAAEKKLRLEISRVVADVRVKGVSIQPADSAS